MRIGIALASVAIVGLMAGCGTPKSIIVATGSCVGIEATIYDTNTPPKVRLGYGRVEFVRVPDPQMKDVQDGGAPATVKETPQSNVLLWIRVANIFDFSSPTIDQKVAIGQEAVKASATVFKSEMASDKKTNP